MCASQPKMRWGGVPCKRGSRASPADGGITGTEKPQLSAEVGAPSGSTVILDFRLQAAGNWLAPAP